MSWNLVILILVVAAVAYVLWTRRDKGGELGHGSAVQPASAGAGGSTASSGPLASYDEYRRVSPSNMVNGKLTCNRCGSNLIAAANGTASCLNCGASLYRA